MHTRCFQKYFPVTADREMTSRPFAKQNKKEIQKKKTHCNFKSRIVRVNVLHFGLETAAGVCQPGAAPLILAMSHRRRVVANADLFCF